jgi:hypothetical protein
MMSLSERIEYRTLDKRDWQRGPWDDEPDKVQFRDEATGLPCLIVRGPCGALCGYVGVAPGHPWHGKDYDSCMVGEEYPDVHWGLTFSGACQHGQDPAKGICHIPAPGEADDVWWLGFDCAHSGDLTEIKYSYGYSPTEDVYRDVAFVEGECRKLARQIASVGRNPKGQDAEERLGRNDEHAVTPKAADAQDD